MLRALRGLGVGRTSVASLLCMWWCRRIYIGSFFVRRCGLPVSCLQYDFTNVHDETSKRRRKKKKKKKKREKELVVLLE